MFPHVRNKGYTSSIVNFVLELSKVELDLKADFQKFTKLRPAYIILSCRVFIPPHSPKLCILAPTYHHGLISVNMRSSDPH